jgi:hypothetical protein
MFIRHNAAMKASLTLQSAAWDYALRLLKNNFTTFIVVFQSVVDGIARLMLCCATVSFTLKFCFLYICFTFRFIYLVPDRFF